MREEFVVVERVVAKEAGEFGVIIADESFIYGHDPAPPEKEDKKTESDYKIIECMEKNPNIPIDIMDLGNKSRRELVKICSEFCSGFPICRKHDNTRHIAFI